MVEDAYGRLKGRWQCLLKRNDTDVSDLPEQVAACYVLHNMCEMHGERFNDDWLENVESSSNISVDNSSTTTLCESGEDIWRVLTAYFINN